MQYSVSLIQGMHHQARTGSWGFSVLRRLMDAAAHVGFSMRCGTIKVILLARRGERLPRRRPLTSAAANGRTIKMSRLAKAFENLQKSVLGYRTLRKQALYPFPHHTVCLSDYHIMHSRPFYFQCLSWRFVPGHVSQLPQSQAVSIQYQDASPI